MPRKKDETAELAQKMLQVLEAHGSFGTEAFPLSVQRLAELADPEAPAQRVEKAAGSKAFGQAAVVARKKSLGTPVARAGDLEALAQSPRLLEFVLEELGAPPYPG